MLIEWNGSLEIGNKQIDDEHKRLVLLANTLYDAITHKQDHRVVLAALREFAAFLHKHFANEEQLMRETGYPGLEAHAADHAAFTREIDQLVINSGIRTDYLDTVVSVVFRLLASHRDGDGADAELAEFLRCRKG